MILWERAQTAPRLLSEAGGCLKAYQKCKKTTTTKKANKQTTKEQSTIKG